MGRSEQGMDGLFLPGWAWLRFQCQELGIEDSHVFGKLL